MTRINTTANALKLRRVLRAPHLLRYIPSIPTALEQHKHGERPLPLGLDPRRNAGRLGLAYDVETAALVATLTPATVRARPARSDPSS